MNWRQTREVLIKINPEYNDLPDKQEYRIDLCEADLFNADLSGADLSEANLSRANLIEANLEGADLEGAYLRGAYLTRVNLTGANLTEADLYRAYLYRANLTGATLTFRSRELLSEILRQAAADDIEKLKLAGLVLMQRHWCWQHFLVLNDPLRGWALDELARWHVEGDNAPGFIVERAARLTANKE